MRRLLQFIRNPEIIGPPDCPLIHRWTLVPIRGGDKHEAQEHQVKLLVHHFLPNADDRDVHDHPRPFWTFVLWGGYDDMKPCEPCEGRGGRHVCECELGRRTPLNCWSCSGDVAFAASCPDCGGEGVVLNERMRAGVLRFRPARHRHRTKVAPKGCWTIVLMGPIRRRWGFWRQGRWWYWKDYEAEFGFAMRCDDLDLEYRK